MRGNLKYILALREIGGLREAGSGAVCQSGVPQGQGLRLEDGGTGAVRRKPCAAVPPSERSSP